MPEASKEAFEMMPKSNDVPALTPDLATDQIQDDESKKIKNVFARLEGNAV
ncbi:MAG: hypothetical protein KBA40_02070 [Candidatus Peribacteraceae bacterium]|nr:hypothetical protein [Candidatus Peribacteraceae bacterium]MBP9850232.1 hypothetical protein [Candidatus Peribacteraceae bacterium]